LFYLLILATERLPPRVLFLVKFLPKTALSVGHPFARDLNRSYFSLHRTPEGSTWTGEEVEMNMSRFGRLLLIAYLALFLLMLAAPAFVHGQNLGTSPATGQAVRGQSADQPEGAFLNLVNWVGNVICPVGAALCVVMAIVHYMSGRGVARWAVAALALLMVSGLTRLLEFWIQNASAVN
jgi:hypothetical protein